MVSLPLLASNLGMSLGLVLLLVILWGMLLEGAVVIRQRWRAHQQEWPALLVLAFFILISSLSGTLGLLAILSWVWTRS